MSFRQSVGRMNAAHMKAFGDEVGSPYGDFLGVFDIPTDEITLRRFQLVSSQPVLATESHVAKKIKKGDELTILDELYVVAKPPFPDGTGLSVIHLLPKQTNSTAGPWQ